jgi:pyruvyl transferase EpsO
MEDKNKELYKIIMDTLTPLIDNDFILLDLPYHTNIGDNLIWEGEIQFLRKITSHRLLYFCSAETFCYHKIDKHVIILLHGGGNFGDVWYKIHQFKEKIIVSYPDNKIIIFPQTIWYADKNLLMHDVKIYSTHKNLIICTRDRESYKFLKEYFIKNTILLVPDMAFCIKSDQIKKYQTKSINRNLFLKRGDIELNINFNYLDFLNDKVNIDIQDWPTIEGKSVYIFLLKCILWISRRIRIFFPKFTDLYAFFVFKPGMIATGVEFMSRYKEVYTTRLHAAILCCLLEKPFVLFDNSYGKNCHFFETWLSDLEGATFIPCH